MTDKPCWWGDSKPPLTPSHDLSADEQEQMEARNAREFLESARKSAEHSKTCLKALEDCERFAAGYGVEALTAYRIALEKARNDSAQADAQLKAAERSFGDN